MSRSRLSLYIIALMLALLGVFPGGASPLYAYSEGDGSGWTPNEDDSWLFEMRTGRWTLGEAVRGYQTDKGICVDLNDVIAAIDVPIRVDKKSRRATGWHGPLRRSATGARDR